MNQEIFYCSNCNKNTLHYGEKYKFNWLLHFVLFILTGFLWLIPFLFYYMSKKDKLVNIKCTECNSSINTNKDIKVSQSTTQKFFMYLGYFFLAMFLYSMIYTWNKMPPLANNSQEIVKG